MKLRLYKAEMKKALMWYTHKLYEKHPNAILTQARLEIIKNDLIILQNSIRKIEPNQVWTVPVGLFVKEGNSAFEVTVSDDSNLLYLDFDQP